MEKSHKTNKTLVTGQTALLFYEEKTYMPWELIAKVDGTFSLVTSYGIYVFSS